MITDNLIKCPKCGGFNVKGIVKDDWNVVYCADCFDKKLEPKQPTKKEVRKNNDFKV